MARVVSLAVRHVGGVESCIAGEIFVDSLRDYGFEIEEMAGVFLNRPAAVCLVRQSFRREAVEQLFEARGCAPRARSSQGKCLWGS